MEIKKKGVARNRKGFKEGLSERKRVYYSEVFGVGGTARRLGNKKILRGVVMWKRSAEKNYARSREGRKKQLEEKRNT